MKTTSLLLLVAQYAEHAIFFGKLQILEEGTSTAAFGLPEVVEGLRSPLLYLLFRLPGGFVYSFTFPVDQKLDGTLFAFRGSIVKDCFDFVFFT